MSTVNNNNIRHQKFWDTSLPLTSKRVRRILSRPESTGKLVSAIRDLRDNTKNGKEPGTFEIEKK